MIRSFRPAAEPPGIGVPRFVRGRVRRRPGEAPFVWLLMKARKGGDGFGSRSRQANQRRNAIRIRCEYGTSPANTRTATVTRHMVRAAVHEVEKADKV